MQNMTGSGTAFEGLWSRVKAAVGALKPPPADSRVGVPSQLAHRLCSCQPCFGVAGPWTEDLMMIAWAERLILCSSYRDVTKYAALFAPQG